MDGVTLIICIILLIIWKIGDQRDLNKVKKQAHEVYHNTNYGRQLELLGIFTTGKGLDGKPLTEPHSDPKEVQRLVKIQLEKEGYRYLNQDYWNLDYCVFDKDGKLISCGGKPPLKHFGS